MSQHQSGPHSRCVAGPFSLDRAFEIYEILASASLCLGLIGGPGSSLERAHFDSTPE